MAVATIASQQAITASPVAAATAAMIGLFSEKGLTEWGLPQILMICVPATLVGVTAAAIISMFLGKGNLKEVQYQARLAAGEIPGAQVRQRGCVRRSSRRAKISAYIFLIGVGLVVAFRLLPRAAQASRGAKARLRCR